MNAAKLDKSERLKRVHDLLIRYPGQWFSTMMIIRAAQVCAVNSIIAEIRQNGVDVECKREGNVWSYRLS